MRKQMMSYSTAKKFIRTTSIKTEQQLKKAKKQKLLPETFPHNPHTIYKEHWLGYGDFLGTGRRKNGTRKYKTFEEAKKIARENNIKSEVEWSKFLHENKSLIDLPVCIRTIYKKQWTNSADFFGTTHYKNKKWMGFLKLRKYARTLGLQKQNDWYAYWNNRTKPNNIPYQPSKVYKNWTNWGDFLGTKNLSPKNRKYVSFNQAKKILKKYRIETRKQFHKNRKINKELQKIHSEPHKFYKEWKSSADFYGKEHNYTDFETAKRILKKLKIQSKRQFLKLYDEQKIPVVIPRSPHHIYGD